MNKQDLYDQIADRKFKPKDLEPYDGSNGRVNKCINLFKNGTLSVGGILVDVGGAIGDLGYAMRDSFVNTVVVDISQKNLSAAKAKGNLTLCADIDEEGFARLGGPVDVITALDFIEHIIDPEKFARECFRLLRNGGQVFINTPNIRFWKHIESLWMRGSFPHTSGDTEVYHGGHLAFFTYNDLVDIFTRAGFRSFEMIMDEEGYEDPPARYLDPVLASHGVKNQEGFKKYAMELGCPNLLFKCVKSI